MKHVHAGLTAAIVLALAGAAVAAGPPAVGDTAPEIKLTTADGTEVLLSSFRGRKNVLVMFLRRGGNYFLKRGKLDIVARPVKRLYYDRDRLARSETEAIIVYPGAYQGPTPTDKAVATTGHDPDGKVYAAYGLNMTGPGKGQWGAFFIDKKGIVQLRYQPLGWQVKKATGREHVDMLDIYADIEKKLGLWRIPAGAKVAKFQQGVTPAGWKGFVGLQIWPRYTKPESLAGKQTAFVRSWTGGEFIILRFDDIVGSAAGRVPAGAKVHKACLRMSTINHASTQKVLLHRMTTPWTVDARFQRSAVADGKDVPWKAPGLGQGGANFDAKPVGADAQVLINYGDVEWDITAAVQDWVNGKPNHGLAVLAEKGIKTPDHGCLAMGPFFRAAQRPMLIVYYAPAGKAAPTPPRVEPAKPSAYSADEARADALLKTAESYRKLRLRTKPREVYQEVIRKYPNTAAAKTAAARLAEMR